MVGPFKDGRGGAYAEGKLEVTIPHADDGVGRLMQCGLRRKGECCFSNTEPSRQLRTRYIQDYGDIEALLKRL